MKRVENFFGQVERAHEMMRDADASTVAKSLAVRWCWRRSELSYPPSFDDCWRFVHDQYPKGAAINARFAKEVATILYHTERK